MLLNIKQIKVICKYKVMMTRNAFTKIVKFMALGSGVLVMGLSSEGIQSFIEISSLPLNIKQVNCKYKVMVKNNVSSKILNF